MAASLPPDSRYVTAPVPAEMREGTELTDADVAKPTERMGVDPDGVQAQITQIRVRRPDHIPAGAPKLDPLEISDDVPLPRSGRALRYDFPLFPSVQVRVVFEGDATADHLEQLVDLLTNQCSRLRAQETRRRAEAAEASRKLPARKIKPKKEKSDGPKQTT